MKKEELSKFVYISIMTASCLTLIYLMCNKVYDINSFFRGTSFSISVITIFWTFYFMWGWKFTPFKFLFFRPNLNGTWRGKLTSDWKDEKGNLVAPREIFIVVRQNFLRIHFTTFTSSFVGYSYSESFNLKKDTGLKNVVYLYRKDTSQSNDEDLREGAAELRFEMSDSTKKLSGKYWTNLKTQGRIEVKHVNNKHVDSYEFAKLI